jgi:hypothetical protein
VFGAKSSVPNYDRFGNTVKMLAHVESGVEKRYVLRCLDDVPVVGPAGSGICEKYSEKYKEICDRCNILLAEPCPKNEKAFVNQKEGKVLGIWFNSENLTWKYPEDKSKNVLIEIEKVMSNGNVSLMQMQSLLGRLNDFLQMCPFLKAFKHNLNETLSKCIQQNDVILSADAVYELSVWKNCIVDNRNWFPIPSRGIEPTIQHKVFISDAAGVPEPEMFEGKEGIGGIGFSEEGCIIGAFQFFGQKTL